LNRPFWPQDDSQQPPQDPCEVVAEAPQLPQQLCLWKRPRRRSQKEGLSQQESQPLAQQVVWQQLGGGQQGVQQVGAGQAGWQQLGQPSSHLPRRNLPNSRLKKPSLGQASEQALPQEPQEPQVSQAAGGL
jgi:hypothetical protein